MTIKETQQLIQIWEEKNGIHRNQLAGMAVLTEVMGDLASALAHNYPTNDNTKSGQELSDKFGDVVWNILSIANQNNIDITNAVIGTLERKNAK